MRVETVKRAIRKVTYIFCVGGMSFAIPLMFVTTLDAVGRYFFSKPLPGTVEISEYMLSIIILLSAAYTQQVKGHVGVDFLTKRLSPSLRHVVQMTTIILSMVIVSILTCQGFIQALNEKTVSDMLRIPQKPFRFLVFVGGLLLFLELIVDLIDLIRKGEDK